MKIGQFAKNNNVSIDTVRHYMEIGLIIPEKRTGQYQFDDKCNEDIQDIIYLKDLEFTLNEIKKIFQYKRLGKLSALQNNQYYKRLFEEKYEEIELKINQYQNAKQKLKNEIVRLHNSDDHKYQQIGIPFSALSLFECKKCSSELSISNGDIQYNQILNGTLHCECDEQYIIKDGILFSSDTVGDSNHLQKQDQVMNDFSHFLSEYIKETDDEFINNILKTIDITFKKLDLNDLKNKTMLHLGTGLGFSLRHIYDSLPNKTLYIAVDHDYQRHQVLKSILETYNIRKNILFICSDFLNIPIKNQSIDYLIDTGTSTYNSNHESFLLKEIQHYLKSKSYLVGSYIYYSNFHVQNNTIEEPFRKYFQIENIKDEINKLNYDPIFNESIIYSDKTPGKYEINIFEGEKVYSYMYIGKKLG
ncbi:MerR family transcriptional regulator [Chengkuizengella sediminis]|uniref:MerR family transcriptional regulator n=1 Tax=Chengkuizengella sediminis TaxID=1885917 RepID=UPI00138A58C8|nr:MerR family transcriptional regulator [Chengkuizengella sediminis]NDI33284.1 MerR family transcriptional regulator [Chengkuizengella sediminis]